jgi:hypothetical protein
MHSRIFLGSLLTCVLGLSFGFAQVAVPRAIAMPDGVAKAGMVTMHVDDMDVEPAKGAPFCATVTTEHTQAFADGNRIHTTDTASVCRDSEGRIRREAALNLLGAAAQGSTPKLITILDPVAGFRYMIDSESKTAHRIPIRSTANAAAVKGPFAGPAGKGEQVMLYQRVGTAGPDIALNAGNVAFKSIGRTPNDPAPTTESLGDQTINGMHTTGTGMTTTIPAGKMGNEQPILITSERWYSPDLKAAVMTKHTDPWAGELKTQLTDVNTSEPDPSLFQVPSDYKIVDEKVGPFILQKRLLAPPPPPQ